MLEFSKPADGIISNILYLEDPLYKSDWVNYYNNNKDVFSDKKLSHIPKVSSLYDQQ